MTGKMLHVSSLEGGRERTLQTVNVQFPTLVQIVCLDACVKMVFNSQAACEHKPNFLSCDTRREVSLLTGKLHGSSDSSKAAIA